VSGGLEGSFRRASARIRYGVALPIVSAPTMTPIARPRASRNHVAIIFIAGGYTPASSMPVRKRKPSATAKPGATISKAFDTAASRALAANSRRDGIRSPRLSNAASAVPTTNPSCTAVVNQPL
jgi:hypothetical protein